ncbi:hypothetical protein [Streptomyces botrytidirepellens]|uniref:Uncharacterized protein n=1 Tax=Streptomyces botrytidirepellens TaxID=2486417 RepID=A0A3M8WV78_9ACTN|nr:hypothetical protein [Streptomyces botrytidirepellens]RNG32959.1 hypothetical protein EEJ42_07560 [Streptomyces botrytidirepellens]
MQRYTNWTGLHYALPTLTIQQGRISVRAAAQHRVRGWRKGAHACLEEASRWRARAVRTEQQHANVPLPAGLPEDFPDRRFLISAAYSLLRTTTATFEDIVRIDAADAPDTRVHGQSEPGDYTLTFTACGRDLVAYAAAPSMWLTTEALAQLAQGRSVLGPRATQ